MPAIDLNSDLGEGLGEAVDNALLALVSSANIACGGHAGDEASMRTTIRVAVANGVRIGAHPSYPDRENFGRTRIETPRQHLASSLERQIDALGKAAVAENARLAYLKPHGALYNDAVAGYGDVVAILCDLAKATGLPLMTLPVSALSRAGSVALITEGFLDRAYRPDGTLVPRSEPGALITTPAGVRAQALALAPAVQSLSLHSDTPGAVELMRHARAALTDAGYSISAS